MNEPARFASLARLARIRRDADLGRLAAAAQRVRSVETQVAALDTTLAEVFRQDPNPDAAALTTREIFARWAAVRRLCLGSDLGAAVQDLARQRTAARGSFGRAQALERLTEQAAAETLRRKAGSD